MKKILLCFGLLLSGLMARSQSEYQRTRDTVITIVEQNLKAKKTLMVPVGKVPKFPAAMTDSCGALFFVKSPGVDTALYVYNCLSKVWERQMKLNDVHELLAYGSPSPFNNFVVARNASGKQVLIPVSYDPVSKSLHFTDDSRLKLLADPVSGDDAVNLRTLNGKSTSFNTRLDSIKAVTFRLSGGNPVITGNQILQSGYWQINKEGVYMGDATTNGKSYIGPNAVVFFNPDNSTAWQWFGPQNAFRFFNPSTQNFVNLFTNWDGTNNIDVKWPLVSGRLLTDAQGAATYGSKAQQDANAQQIAKNSSQIAINKAQISLDSILVRSKADTSRSTYQLSQILGTNGSQDLSLNATVNTADYTSQIQSVFDKAKNGKPIRIIWDVRVSMKTITRSSNTEISGVPGCGFILRDSTNGPAFRNANFTYTGSGVDSNYVTRNLTMNFNGQKQAHDTPTSGWVVGIKYGGVKNVVFENCIFYKSKTFTTYMINSQFVNLLNNVIDVGANAAINADGYHFGGTANYVTIDGLWGRSYDDLWSFCADDALPGNDYQPSGDQRNLTVRNVYIAGGLFGGRYLSASHRIDNVTVDNINGVTNGYALILDNFWQNNISTSPTKVATTVDGLGNFGTLNLSRINVDVRQKQVTFPIKQSIISIAGQFDAINISQLNRRAFAYNSSMVNVSQTYTNIKHLLLRDINLIDTASSNVSPLLQLEGGVVGDLQLSNIHAEKAADIDAGLVLINGATVALMKTSMVSTNHFANHVRITSGSLGIYQATNSTHLNTSASYPLISAASSVAFSEVRGYKGNNIANGSTNVNPRTDTAFVKRGTYNYTLDGNYGVNTATTSVASSPINYIQHFALGTNAGAAMLLAASGTPLGFGAFAQLNGDPTHKLYLYQYNASGVANLANSFGLKGANTNSSATSFKLVLSAGLPGNDITAIPDYLTQFAGGNTVLQTSALSATNNGYLFDVRGTGYYDGLLTLNAGLQSAGSISQTGGSYFRQYYSTTANEYFTVVPNTSTGAYDIGTYPGTSGSNRAMNITSASSIMFDARNYNSMIWKFGGVSFMQLTSSTLYPNTTNTLDFGGTGNRWKSGWFTTASAGHIVGISGAPTIAAGTGAGTSPTISVSGTDLSGTITLTTGSSPAAGAVIATLTFNGAYTAAPIPSGDPAAKNANAASLAGVQKPYYTTTTTTLVLNSNSTALAANTQYIWYYTVTQ